ncbi:MULTISPECIES: SIR2 family protein [Caldilinea]|jgi:hypothetical protein|uniref:Uncharacterized protein n=1 Tax=Caldilinea aerophila (strain DSM 14535 / JCM 11387 / NBRC 104270 / STL-6-O1) TaxID=926550 RepID=I0I160_CALAS|nr:MULTISPECIES: SIR2 family protein [Caldilinea]MBO9392741.1 SIR2 family protein [Caldilinea sp.]BAL98997.1 hypothetical protein CLDAP_09580 [Caldilinea aerophila DSM 14535 = NBRC 104270]GIV74416.1 MAG: hypothetical protein KatS3mg049_2972 [Caldilinea sp.]
MPNTIAWNYIAEQINRKKCTPVVSDQLILETLFPRRALSTEWARSSQYPLADTSLALVAQYLSVTYRDAYRAKTEYLHFLTQRYLEVAEQDANINPSLLDQVRRERGLGFSRLVGERLGYPAPGDMENPLNLLAAFDMPIFLTTSPHLLLETALRNLNKRPRTEVYLWHPSLEAIIPPEFHPNPDFQPTVDEPLVYHLHGLDEFPDSLVLSEEDHFDFISNIIHDFREIGKMPNTVRNAISSTILILLGYNMQSWEMRIILQELIRDQPRRPRSVAIQLDPRHLPDILDADRFQEYVQLYLSQDKFRFDIYWGDALSFLKQLWQAWQGG